MKNRYYKYRPLYIQKDDGSKRPAPNTESIFTKAEIYYSAPADCNDPFDCNMRFHVSDSTDAEWEAYIEDMIVRYPTLDPAQVSKLRVVIADKLWKTPAGIAMLAQDIGKKQLNENYNESSVFCLAKKGNSIPMFSYYSDGHTGIAIEFLFSDTEIPCGIDYLSTVHSAAPKVVFRDVEYPATFPELNYHRLYNAGDKLLRHILFTKSLEWKHEEEFRIFRRKVPKSTTPFDRKLLSRVIFGCKAKTADIDLVKSWLKGWPSDVILSKTEPAPDRFELIVTDIDLVKGV
jgi:hypothetical protein